MEKHWLYRIVKVWFRNIKENIKDLVLDRHPTIFAIVGFLIFAALIAFAHYG